MYIVNLKKKTRADRDNPVISSTFKSKSGQFYSRVLHPTKGWRQRNLAVIFRHGNLIRRIDEQKQMSGRIRVDRIR